MCGWRGSGRWPAPSPSPTLVPGSRVGDEGDDPKGKFDSGVLSAASRDVRLFIVMVGSLAGQGFATLILLACLTNLVVLFRLLSARRLLKDTQ